MKRWPAACPLQPVLGPGHATDEERQTHAAADGVTRQLYRTSGSAAAADNRAPVIKTRGRWSPGEDCHPSAFQCLPSSLTHRRTAIRPEGSCHGKSANVVAKTPCCAKNASW